MSRPLSFTVALTALTAVTALTFSFPASADAHPPASDQPASPEPQRSKDEDTFRLGPQIGVGFPRPFAVEGLATFKGLVGAGVEYSFLPRSTIGGVDAQFKALAADLRVFPFHGGLFVGLRGGKQWLDARTTLTVGPVSSIESMAASTWFVNPSIGYLYRFEGLGLTLGVDAGVQLPIAPEYQRSGFAAGTAPAANIDHSLVSVANALGNSVTPTIDLLRIGFLW